MIFGPELAIRGTEESMHHAVRGMYEERRQALKFFWVGCLFIILSGMALSWMKFPRLTAIIITCVFSSLIAFCAFYVKRLRPKFAYADNSNSGWSELQSSVEGVAQSNTIHQVNSQRRLTQSKAFLAKKKPPTSPSIQESTPIIQ